LRNSEQDNEN